MRILSHTRSRRQKEGTSSAFRNLILSNFVNNYLSGQNHGITPDQNTVYTVYTVDTVRFMSYAFLFLFSFPFSFFFFFFFFEKENSSVFRVFVFCGRPCPTPLVRTIAQCSASHHRYNMEVIMTLCRCHRCEGSATKRLHSFCQIIVENGQNLRW